jgi:hypothetical protein
VCFELHNKDFLYRLKRNETFFIGLKEINKIITRPFLVFTRYDVISQSLFTCTLILFKHPPPPPLKLEHINHMHALLREDWPCGGSRNRWLPWFCPENSGNRVSEWIMAVEGKIGVGIRFAEKNSHQRSVGLVGKHILGLTFSKI